jgi:hypothetical protein
VNRSITFIDSTAIFLAISVNENGTTSIAVDSPIGTPFTLQAASLLGTSTHWTDLVATNPPTMPYVFVDERPQAGTRFYRVQRP